MVDTARFFAVRWPRDWLQGVALSLAVYLATLPLDGFKALSNLALGSALLAFLFSVSRAGWPIARPRRGFWIFVAYALLVTGAIFINPIDVMGSLRRLRSGLGEQLLVLLLAMAVVRMPGGFRLLLRAMAIGFVLLVILTLGRLLLLWLTSPASFETSFHLRQVTPGFGITALFFLPVLAGYLSVYADNRWVQAGGWVIVAVGFLMAIAYNSTSSVLLCFVYLGFLGMAQLARRFRLTWRQLSAVVVVACMLPALFLAREGADKMAAQVELIRGGQYFEMLSRRGGIWAIGLDCVRDAPWYGYGYGQKKVALICSRDQYVLPAREAGNPMADYFSPKAYGSVGFHNQYLENWFVGGGAGSLLWLGFFLAAIWSAWKARKVDCRIAQIILPIVLIYLGGCLFNGLWEAQPMTKGLMVMLAFLWTRSIGDERA